MKIEQVLFYILIFLSGISLNYWLRPVYIFGFELSGQTQIALIYMLIFLILILYHLPKATKYAQLIKPFFFIFLYAFSEMLFNLLFLHHFSPYSINSIFRFLYISLFIWTFLIVDFNAVKILRILAGILFLIVLLTFVITKGYKDTTFFVMEYNVVRFTGFGSTLSFGFYVSLLSAFLYVGIKEKIVSYIFGVTLLIISLYNVYLTASRGALISFILGILAYEILTIIDSKKRSKYLQAIILFSITILSFKFISVTPAFLRSATHGDVFSFTTGRLESIYIIFSQFNIINILFGLGPGAQDEITSELGLVKFHNVYLEIICDFGVIGITLFLFFLYRFFELFKKTKLLLSHHLIRKLSFVSLVMFILRSNIDALINDYLAFTLYFIYPLLLLKNSKIKTKQ